MSPEIPLAGCGYEGISVFGQREIARENGLIRFDAHIDPIDWRGSRSAVSKETIVNELINLLKTNAPIGLMTHHLVHDEAIWSLCSDLVTHLTSKGAHWISARNLLTGPLD